MFRLSRVFFSNNGLLTEKLGMQTLSLHDGICLKINLFVCLALVNSDLIIFHNFFRDKKGTRSFVNEYSKGMKIHDSDIASDNPDFITDELKSEQKLAIQKKRETRKIHHSMTTPSSEID